MVLFFFCFCFALQNRGRDRPNSKRLYVCEEGMQAKFSRTVCFASAVVLLVYIREVDRYMHAYNLTKLFFFALRILN